MKNIEVCKQMQNKKFTYKLSVTWKALYTVYDYSKNMELAFKFEL